MIISIQFSPYITPNDNLKSIVQIKFAYVTNDTAETRIENHIHDYTVPCKIVI
jgi:hypothetical protein